jgi:hypothetical protein
MSFRGHEGVAEALTFVPHASAMTVAATTDTTRATLKEFSVMTATVEAGVPGTVLRNVGTIDDALRKV